MATYCGHRNAPAEYALKDEEEEHYDNIATETLRNGGVECRGYENAIFDEYIAVFRKWHKLGP